MSQVPDRACTPRGQDQVLEHRNRPTHPQVNGPKVEELQRFVHLGMSFNSIDGSTGRSCNKRRRLNCLFLLMPVPVFLYNYATLISLLLFFFSSFVAKFVSFVYEVTFEVCLLPRLST